MGYAGIVMDEDGVIEKLKELGIPNPCDNCEKTPPCEWHECYIHCEHREIMCNMQE